MSRTPYTTNTYVGGAPTAHLNASITSGDTTIVIADTTSGWNGLGSGGGFALALDFGNSNEEKIYVPAGSYSWGSATVTLSGVTRAYDGTTAVSHNSNAPVVHILTSVDLKEANTAVVNTVGKIANAGDLLVGSGANALTNLPAGSQGTVLSSDGSTLSWVPAASGSQGYQGAQGSQGSTGSQGAQGAQGTQGLQGNNGQSDKYATTSFTNLTLATGGSISLTVSTNLSYTVGQDIIVAHDATHLFYATVVSYTSNSGSLLANVNSIVGSGSYNSWTINLDGAVGVQGAQGYQGSTGSQGVQGAQGTQGSQGYQGSTGAQGSQGYQGVQGAGTQGVQGSQGYQGTTGDPGIYESADSVPPANENILWLDEVAPAAVGPQGYQGTQGVQGPIGNQGSQGNQGVQGSQGVQGAQGANGYQGSSGSQGTQGYTGSQGPQGYQGAIGYQGSQGNQGVTGTGTQGAQGAQGAQGTTGSYTTSDSGWIAVSSFTNSFVAGAAVAYRKLNGVIYLRGSVQSGTPANAAFTLPTGYRPSATSVFAIQQYGLTTNNYITINTDGTVVPQTASAWLNNVVYPIS